MVLNTYLTNWGAGVWCVVITAVRDAVKTVNLHNAEGLMQGSYISGSVHSKDKQRASKHVLISGKVH